MLTGLEGLPRSGKSYNAMREHIIPAIQAGRVVLTNILGVNLDAVAQVAEVPVDQVKDLVQILTADQVRNIADHVKPKALVVIDECHEFFPVGRGRLDQRIERFFAMHGHYNLDVVLMTQDFTEVHRTVVKRIERKNVYIKKSVVGKDNSFHCTYYMKVPSADRLKYEIITTKSEDYDPKYFPTYNSFEDNGGEDYEVYKAGGQGFWNRKMKMAVWGFGLLFFSSIGVLVYFFNGGMVSTPAPKPAAKNAQPAMTADEASAAIAAPRAAPVPSKPGKEPSTELVTDLNDSARPRLAGYIVAGDARNARGIVEWRTSGRHLHARLSFEDLRTLGWTLVVSGDMVRLSKGDKQFLITAWPLDDESAISARTNQMIRERGPALAR